MSRAKDELLKELEILENDFFLNQNAVKNVIETQQEDGKYESKQ